MININPKGVKAWVNFTFQPHGDVKTVALVGDWNDWEPEEMLRKKDGSFYKRKYLLLGRNCEFKYLVDGKEWVHDPHVSKVTNSYGSHNSLLKLEEVKET